LAGVDRETLTRQIRDAVDIVDVVGSYVSLKRAGSSFKGLCPFHEEKTPSFHVNPSRQIFKCFGCSLGGDVFSFVQRHEKVDFSEARRILADQAGISLSQEVRGVSGGGGYEKSDLVRVNQWAQEVYRRNYEGSSGSLARNYVSGRRISAESAKSFGVGYAVDSYDSLIREASTSRMDLKLLSTAGLIKERASGGYYDTFRHRLMFPISDVNGRIIGFGGRTLGDDPAKYLNTPATALFDKGSQLFGLDRARRPASESGRIIVVEGYTDCIMAHQHDFLDCVATLGTALTEAHARMLRRYTDRVILLFDSDEAGRRASDRALSATLISGLDVYLARVPEGKDPCDYLLSEGKEGFNLVLKDGIGALEFKWRQLARDYGGSDSGPGRRRAIEAYLEQISTWSGHGAIDPIQKGLLLNQLSKVLSLPVEDLHRQLESMLRRRKVRTSGSEGSQDGIVSEFGDRSRWNAEQAALQQIVEVLLNKPELYSVVEDDFDPSLIHLPALSELAGELVSMMGSGRPFRIDELIGRFESLDYGPLITELQLRGERRGDFEKVLGGAVSCLESVKRAREAVSAAKDIRNYQEDEGVEGDVGSDEDKRLQELADSLRRPHFSTAKARKKFLE